MKPVCFFALALWSGMGLADEARFGVDSLPPELSGKLLDGETVVLPGRPDETGAAESDSRFVSVARLLEGSRETIWEVIHDKEGAEHFLDGVLESRVLEETDAEIIVEQRTRVGGPKGDYLYRLRHRLTPMTRSDFSFIEGEIRNVLGTWWIFDGPDPNRHLVVYSLHIDPGVFAPQFVVKRGMKKSMPRTIRSIQKEVHRRENAVSEDGTDERDRFSPSEPGRGHRRF